MLRLTLLSVSKGDADSSTSAAEAAKHLCQCFVFVVSGEHKVQVAVVVPLREAPFGTELQSEKPELDLILTSLPIKP